MLSNESIQAPQVIQSSRCLTGFVTQTPSDSCALEPRKLREKKRQMLSKLEIQNARFFHVKKRANDFNKTILTEMKHVAICASSTLYVFHCQFVLDSTFSLEMAIHGIERNCGLFICFSLERAQQKRADDFCVLLLNNTVSSVQIIVTCVRVI